MADPFLAEIRIFACNFAPATWAFCDGNSLPVFQNTALFSVIGTTFGGNGTTAFQLPNMQGRVALHQNPMVNSPPPPHPAAPGRSARVPGATGGVDTVTLQSTQMPSHGHTLEADSFPGDLAAPSSTRALARSASGTAYKDTTTNLTPFSSSAILPVVGGSGAHENRMPYLTLNFCIALRGVFPPHG